ncbi:MAG: nuclear transport factor 2 family protein [Actinomycetota bacterium]|nr:nuclear transport factor 2 family protein [Actinomycetota bacterium]
MKEGYEAWNRGDRSWVLEHMSEDVEWITPSEDLDRGTYRGHEGVQQFWEEWQASVGRLDFTVERTIDAGDHVAVIARRSGKGEHSGLEVSDQVVQVFTFQGEKCVRVHEYYDTAAALREIGVETLDEQ